MKQITVIVLLLVLGATAWGMTRVVVFDEKPPGAAVRKAADDNHWRRTNNGWQRLPLDGEAAKIFEAPLHPAVVASAELCFALLGLLALSRCSVGRRPHG